MSLGDLGPLWIRNAKLLGYASAEEFAIEAMRQKLQSAGLPRSPIVSSFEALLVDVRAGQDGAIDSLEAQLRDFGLVGPPPVEGSA